MLNMWQHIILQLCFCRRSLYGWWYGGYADHDDAREGELLLPVLH